MTTTNAGARRALLGYGMIIVSYALMLAELPLLIVFLRLSRLGSFDTFGSYFGQLFLGPAVPLLLLGISLVLLKMYRAGKRLLIRTAEETLAGDSRPYVLYLRAFDADILASSVPEHGDPDQSPWARALQFPLPTAMKFVSPRLLFAPPLTEEEQIVRAFNREIGPVIAVGTPGEAAPLGASRLYLTEENWQTRVTELVRNAGAVVIRVSQKSHVAPQSVLGTGSGAGLTQGLQWEVANVPREVPPGRLWFLIAANDEAYGQFWSLVHDSFPQGLPSFCESSQRAGRVRGMIGFDNDWQPRLFPMSRSATSPLRLTRYPVTTAIRERLRAIDEKRLLRPPWLSLAAGSLSTLFFAVLFVIGAFSPVWVEPSELRVIIPPATVPVLLTKVRLPVPPPGLVRSAKSVRVTVTIGPRGELRAVHAGSGEPALAAFVENTVKKWRFQPVLWAGLPTAAMAVFNYIPPPRIVPVFVPASEVMLTVPPANVPQPLSTANLPRLDPRLVRSEENVLVTVLISPDGSLLNVRAAAKNAALASMVQNTVKTWRFQPVRRVQGPVWAISAFTLNLKPPKDRPVARSPRP